MSNKKLTKENIEEIKNELLRGKTSREVSSTFNLSVSTINNLRLELKEQGFLFPNNRGRRPSEKSEQINEIRPKGKTVISSEATKLTYHVNGTTIIFNTKPKSLYISPNQIEIDF